MCSITPSAEVLLPLDDHAPKAARDFARRNICSAHQAAVGDEAELLVSELVTNSFRHSAPPVRMHIACEAPGGLRISVRNGAPGVPEPRSAGIDDESGRGMFLLDVISEAWGVDSDEHGKTVWCCLVSCTGGCGVR
ncbi:MAG: ATP-binding protein [Janthinobacterium lividum]